MYSKVRTLDMYCDLNCDLGLLTSNTPEFLKFIVKFKVESRHLNLTYLFHHNFKFH